MRNLESQTVRVESDLGAVCAGSPLQEPGTEGREARDLGAAEGGQEIEKVEAVYQPGYP